MLPSCFDTPLPSAWHTHNKPTYRPSRVLQESRRSQAQGHLSRRSSSHSRRGGSQHRHSSSSSRLLCRASAAAKAGSRASRKAPDAADTGPEEEWHRTPVLVDAQYEHTLVRSYAVFGLGLDTGILTLVRVRPAHAGDGRYFVCLPTKDYTPPEEVEEEAEEELEELLSAQEEGEEGGTGADEGAGEGPAGASSRGSGEAEGAGVSGSAAEGGEQLPPPEAEAVKPGRKKAAKAKPKREPSPEPPGKKKAEPPPSLPSPLGIEQNPTAYTLEDAAKEQDWAEQNEVFQAYLEELCEPDTEIVARDEAEEGYVPASLACAEVRGYEGAAGLTLRHGGYTVHSVEALLAALEAAGIEDARIEIERATEGFADKQDPRVYEVPALDGTATLWSELTAVARTAFSVRPGDEELEVAPLADVIETQLQIQEEEEAEGLGEPPEEPTLVLEDEAPPNEDEERGRRAMPKLYRDWVASVNANRAKLTARPELPACPEHFTLQEGDSFVTYLPSLDMVYTACVEEFDEAPCIGRQWFSWFGLLDTEDAFFNLVAGAKKYMTLETFSACRDQRRMLGCTKSTVLLCDGQQYVYPDEVDDEIDECARNDVQFLVGGLALLARDIAARGLGGRGLVLGHILSYRAPRELQLRFLKDLAGRLQTA